MHTKHGPQLARIRVCDYPFRGLERLIFCQCFHFIKERGHSFLTEKTFQPEKPVTLVAGKRDLIQWAFPAVLVPCMNDGVDSGNWFNGSLQACRERITRCLHGWPPHNQIEVKSEWPKIML